MRTAHFIAALALLTATTAIAHQDLRREFGDSGAQV